MPIRSEAWVLIGPGRFADGLFDALPRYPDEPSCGRSRDIRERPDTGERHHRSTELVQADVLYNGYCWTSQHKCVRIEGRRDQRVITEENEVAARRVCRKGS